MPIIWPAFVAHQTIRYEKIAIQMILPINVMGKYFLSEKKIQQQLNNNLSNTKPIIPKVRPGTVS